MSGILYLVATPIGNLEDITLRAIKTLENVDIIAAEDTRQTLKLLNHLNIKKPLISYHRHSDTKKENQLITFLNSGKNIALVSDAGTPVISDPGEEIVKLALQNDINIIPIPGACAFINALIASGLSCKEFAFYGFLSLNKSLRLSTFEDIKKQNKTIILYEAPHKILKTLDDIKNFFGDIEIVIAKELTKIHETFYRGTISEVKELLSPKGEYIILFENHSKTNKEIELEVLNSLSLEDQYNFYLKKGLEKKDIIKQIAKNNNVNKNEIYKNFVKK